MKDSHYYLLRYIREGKIRNRRVNVEEKINRIGKITSKTSAKVYHDRVIDSLRASDGWSRTFRIISKECLRGFLHLTGKDFLLREQY